MKTILLITLAFSLNAFSLPAQLQLNGTMIINKSTLPTTINVALKKEKGNKAKYEGTLVYVYNNTPFQKNIGLELKTDKKTIWGYTQLNNGDRLDLSGKYINLASQETVNLNITRSESYEDCHYKFGKDGEVHETCRTRYRSFDVGDLTATVK